MNISNAPSSVTARARQHDADRSPCHILRERTEENVDVDMIASTSMPSSTSKTGILVLSSGGDGRVRDSAERDLQKSPIEFPRVQQSRRGAAIRDSERQRVQWRRATACNLFGWGKLFTPSTERPGLAYPVAQALPTETSGTQP